MQECCSRFVPRQALPILFLWSIFQPAGVALGQSVRDAVKYEGAIICLERGERFLAWDVESGKPELDMSAELSKASILRIASNGKRLWGVQRRKLLEWSPGQKSWEEVAKIDPWAEEPVGFAVVGETPLLIFPDQVLSPTKGRMYGVPQLKGQFDNLRTLRVLAVQPMDRVLWIGTGNGEWGGHLVGLDVGAGRWVQFYDALHYVTGIARGPNDELIVSWSMSHFGANTLIRIHKPDATPLLSHPELEGHYYQKLTYSSFDNQLYGLDDHTLVSIREGKPTTVAKLDVAVFEREPNAIGVAPGIAALLTLAPKTLIIVPNRSGPLLLRGGEAIPLQKRGDPTRERLVN